MGVRANFWDNTRIGGSAVPFRVKQGWLEIYHGVDQNKRYCLDAVLLDENEPWKVLARSKNPILEPECDYELNGFFGHVVFSCGILYEEETVKIYYGASDTTTAYAEVSLEEIMKDLE